MSFMDPKPLTPGALDAAVAGKVTTPGSAVATALSATILTQTATAIGTPASAARTAVEDVINNKVGAETLSAARPRPIRPQETVLTTFAAAHGWTSPGLGNIDITNDDGGWAAQCVAVTTSGTAGGRNVESPAMTAFNPAGKTFVVKVKIDDWTKFYELELWLGTSSTYTDATRYRIAFTTAPPPYENGEWALLTFNQPTATVGAGVGTAATHARLRVVDKGSGPVTAKWGGLSYYTPSAFTNGVVTFTFDDSAGGQWSKARPALSKYRYRGTIFTIIDYIGDPGMLTMDQLKKLDAEGWEIGAHASTYAAHAKGLPAMTPEELEDELQFCKAFLVNNGFKSESFAYPQSLSNSTVHAAVQRYFQFARSGGFGGVKETLPAMKLPSMRSFSVQNTTTLASMQAAINEAATYGQHLIFLMHDVTDTAAGLYDISTANLAALVETCKTSGVSVLPLSDVYSKLV